MKNKLDIKFITISNISNNINWKLAIKVIKNQSAWKGLDNIQKLLIIGNYHK